MTISKLLQDIGVSVSHSTPVIEAAETAECGLACIAMVARSHGLDVDLGGLRQRFNVSILGLRLKSIMEMAERLGFSSRALRLDLDSLKDLTLPAILHWDLNHFVVLTKVKGQKVTIHDPSVGARTLSLKDAGDHFTGVALELRKHQAFVPMKLRNNVSLGQLWSQISGLTSTLSAVFLMSAILAAATFAAPFQLQLVVDNAIYQSDRDLLRIIAVGFGGLLVIQVAIQYLRDRAVLVVSNLFGYQLVGNVVRHLMRLPSSYFEKRTLGDILSRIRSTDPIRSAVTQGIIGAIIDGIMAIIAVVLLFFYSALLTGIVLASILLYLAIMLFAYPLMKGRTQEQIVANAVEQSNLMENLRGAVTIKLMGGEAEREARWRNLYARVINKAVAIGNIQINTSALQGVIFGIQSVLVVYFGAAMVIDGAGFSVGMLIAFLSFRQTFSDRLMSLIAQLLQYRLLSLHLDRLGDIIYTRPEPIDDLETRVPLQGEIEFLNVSFRYGADDPQVLKGCSLKIPAGSHVVLLGASGAGKSTLLKLMLGLYAAEDGEILLDGRKATAQLWRAWRSQVGYVAQDDRLFSGTIADNIGFFDPILDMERVTAAAKAAKISTEIERMPMQYLSGVGDMGSALSGGQRQRILLARALYRNPKILILDEGTANLDEKTENTLADLVRSLPMTRIIVTHRPALLQGADAVFAVHNGAVSELSFAQRDQSSTEFNMS